MELFSNLSDDQVALLGCAVALVTSGTIMCLSHFIGRSRVQSAQKATRIAMPVVAQTADVSEQRHAA